MLQFLRGKEQVGGGSPIPPKAGSTDWMAGSNERYYGLENFGNTCYCNSVLQALYFCKPFRSCVLGYSYPVSSAALAASDAATGLPPLSLPLQTPIQTPIQSSSSTSSAALPFGLLLDSLAQEKSDETLLTTLRDLFAAIASAKKKSGVVKPVNFVSRLKKENELFQGVTQQDAQEFLNFLLNAIAEILIRHKKEMADKLALLGVIPKEDTKGVETSSSKNSKAMAPATWIHSLFEGLLSNETKCLTCETTTTRTEPFLDLSIDISQHSSISTCLRNFSVSETLCAKDKFYCDTCKSLQEAEKRMKIFRLPNVLVVHLKRFKYQENLQRFIKLNYRVAFPMELKLFNTSDDTEDPDRLYTLSSIIIHLGIGPHQGHYIALVKSGDHWIAFDDETVEKVEEAEILRYFGDVNQPGTGYMFVYERVGWTGEEVVEALKVGGGNTVGTGSGTTGSDGDEGLGSGDIEGGKENNSKSGSGNGNVAAEKSSGGGLFKFKRPSTAGIPADVVVNPGVGERKSSENVRGAASGGGGVEQTASTDSSANPVTETANAGGLGSWWKRK